MTMRVEMFGPGSPEVAFTEYRLATLLNDIGDHGEALALRSATLPPGHRLTASSESQLGECLVALGRAREGEALLVRGYESLLAGAGPAHENTATARERLVKLYEATGRPELAAKLQTPPDLRP